MVINNSVRTDRDQRIVYTALRLDPLLARNWLSVFFGQDLCRFLIHCFDEYFANINIGTSAFGTCIQKYVTQNLFVSFFLVPTISGKQYYV